MGHSPDISYGLQPEMVECIPGLCRRLLSWFERNGRSFPWRPPGRTAYETVVAEILLQRTTAAGVARAYSGFIEHYPSWATLAQAPLDDLENALRPSGSGGKRRWLFNTWLSPSKSAVASFLARGPNWSACGG